MRSLAPFSILASVVLVGAWLAPHKEDRAGGLAPAGPGSASSPGSVSGRLGPGPGKGPGSGSGSGSTAAAPPEPMAAFDDFVVPAPRAWVATPVGPAGKEPRKSALDVVEVVRELDRARSVEAVFVIDVTASMGWIFEDARERALALLSLLERTRTQGARVRAALVPYRDRKDPRPVHTGFMSDWKALREAFGQLRAEGGGDAPEDVQGALEFALGKLPWSAPSTTTERVLYLIGDAPSQRYADLPHVHQYGKRAREMGVKIHAFNAARPKGRLLPLVERDFSVLAQASGGSYERIEPIRAESRDVALRQARKSAPKPPARPSPEDVDLEFRDADFGL